MGLVNSIEMSPANVVLRPTKTGEKSDIEPFKKSLQIKSIQQDELGNNAVASLLTFAIPIDLALEASSELRSES